MRFSFLFPSDLFHTSIVAYSNLILNSTDRALRVLTVSPQTGALAPIHRFQDLVNRTPWHAVGFSGDGEYVLGGAGHKMSHNVFVWDREAGALVKVLEGPKESLMDADVSDERGSCEENRVTDISGTPHGRLSRRWRTRATSISGRLARLITGRRLPRASRSWRRTSSTTSTRTSLTL